MSLKLCEGGACFPTWVEPGFICSRVGTVEIKIPMPQCTKDVPETNKFYNIPNVMVVQEYDDKLIVIRFDGSCTWYNKDYYVLFPMNVDLSVVYDSVKIYNVCVYEVEDYLYENKLYVTSQEIIIDPSLVRPCLILDSKSEEILKKEFPKATPFYPRLVLDDNIDRNAGPNNYREISIHNQDDSYTQLTGKWVSLSGYFREGVSG